MDEVVYFDNLYQLNRRTTKENYDNMEKQMSEFIAYVKSKNLSPMEEIMLVYDRVKLLEPAGSDNSLESRDLPNVLKSGKAVCAGYTSLFNEYLSRLGYKNCAIECYVGETSHMYSMVEVNDDKYDIHGIYTFDPTLDSLDKDSQDRTMSYAFFGRTIGEMKSLKEQRTSRGCSVALVDGFTDNKSYESFYQEIPLRTMNIVNGFFPSEENKQFLQTIYQQGKDKNNWHSLNEKFMFEIGQLGQRARRIDNIPLSKIEEIIKNTRQLSRQETPEELTQVLQFNNSQFKRYFDDTRLVFEITPDDFIREEDYASLIAKIREILINKKDGDEIISTISFLNNHEQQVLFSMMRVNGEEVEHLLSGTLKSDYNFGRNFLSQFTEEYINHSQFPVGKIQKPQYFNLNMRDYAMTSENGCSLILEATDLDYLISLDKRVKAKKDYQISKVDGILSGESLISLNDLTKEELGYLKKQTQSIKTQDYNQYRSKLLMALTMKNPEDYIHSSFSVDKEDGKTCTHIVERIVGEQKETLSQRDFDYDDIFRTQLLEQAIIDYAKVCPIDSEQMTETQQYRVISDNNSVMSLNNFDPEYLKYLVGEIKKVNPEEFRQKLQQQQMQNVLRRNSGAGFANILLISSIVGFIAGFIAFITYMVIKMKGIG